MLSQIEEDCLCRGIYYSGIVNTLSSCECNQGMKAILVKYTGNVVLKELIFYFSTNREYEKCSFTNIQPNDILECISYPYSKFVSDVMIKMISSDINDIDNNCISSIHTSCSMNILDLSPSGCNNLNIVGWIDGSDHICKSLQAQSFQPNNYLDTGFVHN